jgi:hypothetical protein
MHTAKATPVGAAAKPAAVASAAVRESGTHSDGRSKQCCDKYLFHNERPLLS